MTDTHAADITFFNPDIHYSGPSEHATRFIDIYKLEYEAGRSCIEAFAGNECSANKLKAIQYLSNFIDHVSTSINASDQNYLFGQLALGLFIKKAYVIEDTLDVSSAIADLIVKLYDKHQSTTDKYKLNLFEYFLDVAMRAEFYYGDDHPDSWRIPRERADQLLKRIVVCDPSFADINNVGSWTVDLETAVRNDIPLTRKGLPWPLKL